MGLFSKMTGGVDKKLLETGLPGRGIITDVKLTGTTLQSGNGLVQRSCVFTLEVSLDGKDPYTASVKQRIPEIQIPQIQVGSTTVAVRANPDDPSQIAIDFNAAPPEVTTAAGQGEHSAAQLLATGAPGTAVIQQWQELGKKNPEGVEIYAFALTVMPEGKDPYVIQVGNPTPPKALPFLFPGSKVPVKIGNDPNAVVIDWDQAVAEDKKKG